MERAKSLFKIDSGTDGKTLFLQSLKSRRADKNET